MKSLTSTLVACLFSIISLNSLIADQPIRRFLYVATPGIRDYLEWGGHGVIVFDIERHHEFVKRIPLKGLNEKGAPRNVKGICANSKTQRLYVSTTHSLCSIDLATDQMLWEKVYDGGCDRMSMNADGTIIYLPSFEKDFWNIVDASTGDVIDRIDTPNTGAHNTVVDISGKHAYLAGLRSPILRIVDTTTNKVTKQAGPFSASIRPFTVNSANNRCYVNVNELLGFEIGDLITGKRLNTIEVQGFQKGPVKRHGCPSHGIGLTPDDKELWVCDAFNRRVHYFDVNNDTPKQLGAIECRDEPGWVTFSIDGKYAYPSSGEVVDVKTHKIIGTLEDEQGRHVASEKLLEIDFVGSKPVAHGNQFGIGRQN